MRRRSIAGLLAVLLTAVLPVAAALPVSTALPVAVGLPAYALSVPKLTIDESCLVPENISEVAVAGRLSRAKGQMINVYGEDGQTVLLQKKINNAGGRAADFRIRIPEAIVKGKLDRNSELTVYVQSEPVSGIGASKKVRAIIFCGKFLKTQSIRSPKKITLTNLKQKTKINAHASSGMAVSYRSSKPNVVSVTKAGKVTRKKNGKAVITVTQVGDGIYLPVKKRITVISRRSTRKEQVDAAVDWAERIAGDNSFAYGTGRGAHNYGCYYCKTNYGPRRYNKPSARYRKTYCCNPFVHAAYAHGARHPKMLKACRAGSGIGMAKWTYYRYGCWKCVGKPPYRKLRKGDVLVTRRHVAMYVGEQKLAEAASANWSAGSIAVKHMSKARYRRISFVMRYTGY